MFRLHVAAIIEWLHTSDPLWRITDKPITSDVNLAFHLGLHHGFQHARLAVTGGVLLSAAILVG